MAIPKSDRNKVEIVGEVTGAPVLRSFDSGSKLLSFSVRTRAINGDQPVTDSVPVSWWDPTVPVEEGERVRIIGRVHRRFYQTPAGLRTAVEVVAQSVDW